MVDARDLKSLVRKGVRVRIPDLPIGGKMKDNLELILVVFAMTTFVTLGYLWFSSSSIPVEKTKITIPNVQEPEDDGTEDEGVEELALSDYEIEKEKPSKLIDDGVTHHYRFKCPRCKKDSKYPGHGEDWFTHSCGLSYRSYGNSLYIREGKEE